MDRKKGKGKREKKVGCRAAGGVLIWADSPGRGMSVNVLIGGRGAGRRHGGPPVHERGRRINKGNRVPLLLLR
jgi:hypothetical protein